MVWVAVGLVWCENLYGDQGAQCSDKGYKNRPPTGNIELRQNEPAYSREHSAKPHEWPTAKKKNFRKTPGRGGERAHCQNECSEPADSGAYVYIYGGKKFGATANTVENI